MKTFFLVLVFALALWGLHLMLVVDRGLYVADNWTVECRVERETMVLCPKEESRLQVPEVVLQAGFPGGGGFFSPTNPNSPLNPASPNRKLLSFGSSKSKCEDTVTKTCIEYTLSRKQTSRGTLSDALWPMSSFHFFGFFTE